MPKSAGVVAPDPVPAYASIVPLYKSYARILYESERYTCVQEAATRCGSVSVARVPGPPEVSARHQAQTPHSASRGCVSWKPFLPSPLSPGAAGGGFPIGVEMRCVVMFTKRMTLLPRSAIQTLPRGSTATPDGNCSSAVTKLPVRATG